MHGLWKCLTTPWLATLLRQTALCRGLMATVAVLGAAHLMGWSIWPCPVAFISGLPCPGCGMTRAVAALLRGEVALAMAFHPFVLPFALLGLLLSLGAVLPERWREPLVKEVAFVENRTRLPTIILCSALIYGLLRMGGLCSSATEVKPSPVRAYFQERWSGDR